MLLLHEYFNGFNHAQLGFIMNNNSWSHCRCDKWKYAFVKTQNVPRYHGWATSEEFFWFYGVENGVLVVKMDKDTR